MRKLAFADLGRYGLLAIPLLFMVVFLLAPVATSFVLGFWVKAGLSYQPALTLENYERFFEGIRLLVLERTLLVATVGTGISLAIAYPVAYFLATRAGEWARLVVFLLITIPFLVNYIIRNFGWAYLLGREGPINGALLTLGVIEQPLDWLLFSDFAVFLGLVAAYMPFMIFPLWLALAGINRRLVEASWLLGANPLVTFLRVVLPLSLPGVFAAVIFGFVGIFGESAVPVILGGGRYQLIGREIASTMEVLHYPLAAAITNVVIAVMASLLVLWYRFFDLRSFLGTILRWRY